MVTADRPLTDYDYQWVLLDPEKVGVPRPAAPPLLEVRELEHHPLVHTSSTEPLVQVLGRRVRDLAVYWHAGWPDAIGASRARAGTVERLAHAAELLPAEYGLAVLDAWRPLALQRRIFDAAYADPTLPAGFVSEPSADPTTPPPHLTGGTVDVTLTWRGHALALGTPFDDFTDEAHLAAYEQRPGLVRDLRRLLTAAMVGAGFVAYELEWWHYEYGTRRWAAHREAAPLYGAAHR